MELQIGDLISAIKKDGVEAAQTEAERIVSEAKKTGGGHRCRGERGGGTHPLQDAIGSSAAKGKREDRGGTRQAGRHAFFQGRGACGI